MGVPWDRELWGGFLELNWPQGWLRAERLAWQRDREGGAGRLLWRWEQAVSGHSMESREAWLGDLEFTDSQEWTWTQVSGCQWSSTIRGKRQLSPIH